MSTTNHHRGANGGQFLTLVLGMDEQAPNATLPDSGVSVRVQHCHSSMGHLPHVTGHMPGLVCPSLSRQLDSILPLLTVTNMFCGNQRVYQNEIDCFEHMLPRPCPGPSLISLFNIRSSYSRGLSILDLSLLVCMFNALS